MKLLDLTFETPAGNLAADEVLLDFCEGGACSGGVLRFWESRDYFVVVGYANSVSTEVNRAACEARGIPIFRRCSGGGTVLQGPGCVNYSLILPIERGNGLESITSANRFIMERNRQAVTAALPRAPGYQMPEIRVQGHTDLTMNGKKISGNAQRRKRHFLLFHGAFLLGFDLRLISECLQQPSREPEYREHRAHEDFLTNLPVAAEDLKRTLREVWNAENGLMDLPLDAVASLARNKYLTAEWNFRF